MSSTVLSSYSSVEESLARYNRNDRHLFRKFLELAESLEEKNFPYLLIGSLPIPLLVNPRFKEKISSTGDIDVAVNRDPLELTHLLQKYGDVRIDEDQLIRRAYWHGIRGYTVEQEGSIVYHLKIAGFPDTCIFWKEVNVIPLHGSDFEDSGLIQVDGQRIPMPRLGLFLATRLHPQATEDTRAYKSALVVESLKDSEVSYVAEETRERFLKALEKNPDKLRVEHFHRTKRFLENMGGQKRFERFLEYLNRAFNVDMKRG